MTTEQSTTEEIRATLREIAAIDIERELVRSSALGTALDFSAYQGLFEEVQRFVSSLAELPFENLPDRAQGPIRNALDQLQRAIDGVMQFSSAQQGESERDSRASQLQQNFDAFKFTVIPYAGYLYWTSINLQEYQRDLDALIKNAEDSVDQSLQELDERKSESDQMLDAIRKATAEAGVSQEATTFREAAQRYETVARRWLWWSLVAVVITVGAAFALVFVLNKNGQISEADVLQIVLTKAAVLAVLAYVTVTTVRLYRSNAHLAAVNRHREDALRTFRTFVEGTEAGEIKDKVLLAAAHAAFGQTATGLIGEKSERGNVLEVLDGIGGNLIRPKP